MTGGEFDPSEHRLFAAVVVTAIVGPFLYGVLASFLQLPPATFVIRLTVRGDGRYPVYSTAIYTFILMEGCLMLLLLPALFVKKLAQRVGRR